MPVVEVPLDSELPHFTQRTLLDGVTYQLAFDWNDRDESWYASLLADDGTPIAMGRRVSTSWPLFRTARSTLMPLGVFLVVDSQTPPTDPGIDELGTRVRLQYITAGA